MARVQLQYFSGKKISKDKKEQDLKWWVNIGYERQCQINTCSNTEQMGYLNFVFK